MAHFIFSVAVVLLWLVAWGIYLVFVKSLKREMEGVENSNSNENVFCHYSYRSQWISD